MLSLSTILYFALVLILVFLYKTIKKKQNFWAEKGIKYLKPTFFLGNIEIIRSKCFAEKQIEWFNSFPEERYHGMYQFLTPTLVIKDPDLMKLITVKEFDHFVDHRTFVDPDVDPFWGKNLFSSHGERWRDLRSLLSPAFTGSKMRLMYTLIEECAQNFVAFFEKQPSQIVEIEVKDAITRYTNDVIATTAFGLRCNSLENRDNQFYLMGKEGTNFKGLQGLKFFGGAISPALFKLLQIKLTPSRVREYFCKIIEDTVTTRKENKIVRPDMLHLLIEAQKARQDGGNKQPITLVDITSQAFIFFLAGFDTVSGLITFTFYELALNPDIQSRLRQEIASVSGQLTYETLSSLKYLDMVISESLRKWPPASLTDRKVTKAFTIQPERPGEKPLRLEEGDICWFLIYGIHRNPKFYPDPDKFDPERFSDENKHKINPSTYMPFGAGPRNCIGSRFALLESKLIICHVLQRFEIVPVKKTLIPMVLDKDQFNVFAKGGMYVGLKKLEAK